MPSDILVDYRDKHILNKDSMIMANKDTVMVRSYANRARVQTNTL